MSDIRSDLAALEAAIAGLHDEVSRTALAAYAAPDDADLRREADQALASLRDATDRLQQLNAAAALAERQEQDAAERKHIEARQKARDRLIRERDQILANAEKEAEKFQTAEAELVATEDTRAELEAEQADLARRWKDLLVKIDVLNDRRDNASSHHLEAVEAADAIDARLAADLLTDEDVAAENARQTATQAEDRARQTAADEAARLAELLAENDRLIREAYDGELIEVEPARLLPGVSGNGWRWDGGLVVGVPRRDLERLETERQRYVDDVAARAAAEAAETAARAKRKEKADAEHLKRLNEFYGAVMTPGEWARSSGARNAEQAA